MSIVAIVLIAGCVGQTSTEPTTSAGSTRPPAKTVSYNSSALGVSLNYPADWSMNDMYLPDLAFLSPDQTAYVLIEVKDLLIPTTLQEYASFVVGPNAHIIESAEASMAGYPAYRVVFSEKAVEISQFLKIWTIKGNKVYVLNYGTLAKNYAAHLSEVQTMINSLEIA